MHVQTTFSGHLTIIPPGLPLSAEGAIAALMKRLAIPIELGHE